MALNAQQVSDAQQWINNNYGGGFDPSGQFKAGTLFNNGAFSDPNKLLSSGSGLMSGDAYKQGILGAAQGMGYTPADVSQIFGGAYSPGDVQTYEGNHQPQIQGDMMQFQAQHGMPVSSPGSTPPANLGMGSPSLQAYKQNPYLTDMAQGLQRQFNDNLTMNTLPAIRGGAVATGGVGGSREGVAQGLAIGQSNKGAADAIANLFGGDYESQMARNLQQYGMDQGYSLGQGNLALGNKNADYNYNLGVGNLGLGYGNLALGNQNSMQSFYNTQRGLDQSGQALGANIYGLGNQGQWSGLNNANNLYNNYTGYGSNTTGSGGGGASGAAGGALAGSVIGKNLGLGGGYIPNTSLGQPDLNGVYGNYSFQ